MIYTAADIRQLQRAAWAVREIGQLLTDDLAQAHCVEGPRLDDSEREGLFCAVELAGRHLDEKLAGLEEHLAERGCPDGDSPDGQGGDGAGHPGEPKGAG